MYNTRLINIKVVISTVMCIHMYRARTQVVEKVGYVLVGTEGAHLGGSGGMLPQGKFWISRPP